MNNSSHATSIVGRHGKPLCRLALSAAIAALSCTAHAVDGDLDLSFGSQGFRSVAFDLGGANTDTPHHLIALENGGFVAVGSADSGDGSRDAVATRLTAAGALDSNFASSGRLHLVTAFEAERNQDFLGGVELPDHQLVLVGSFNHFSTTLNQGVSAFLRARVSSSGTVQDIGAGAPESFAFTYEIRSATLSPTGTVYETGQIGSGGSNPQFAAREYLPASDSILGNFGDPGTPGNAIVNVNPGFAQGIDGVTASLLLPDNSLLLGGIAQRSASLDYDYAIAHLLPNGSLAGGVGTGLYAFDQVGSIKTDVLRAMAVDPQGRVWLAGEVARNANGSDTDIGIVRLNPNLTIDLSLNGTGRTVLHFDDNAMSAADSVGGIAITADGKVLVVGTHRTNAAQNISDIAVMRLNTDGTPDASFGTAGRRLYDFSPGPTKQDIGADVVVQGNRAVILGRREFSGADTDFVFFAIQNQGNSDAVFKNGFE